MNKTELIEQMAHDADITKTQAHRALDAALAAIERTIKRGGDVSLQNFGKFEVVQRAAKPVRDPRTGRQFVLQPRRAVKFSPSKSLKESMN